MSPLLAHFFCSNFKYESKFEPARAKGFGAMIIKVIKNK